ncbi:response regulator [Radiobacillus sp. PE A8.2]|uniref:response regulator transcription factor n=1 Tax=Radiobacillus sp. PE A8.2 TaxID=3380349 RepID=UPI00388D89C3
MYKILLAEDEIWVRKGIKTLISRISQNFYVSDEAEDGDECIHKMRLNPPDVLITDVKMPGRNGLEVAQFAIDNFPDTSCIIVSGYQEFSWVQQAIKLGSVDYLLKPVGEEQLKLALKKAVEKKNNDQLKNTLSLYNLLLSLESTFQRAIEGHNDDIKRLRERLIESLPNLGERIPKILLVFDDVVSREKLQTYVIEELHGIMFYANNRVYAAIIPIPASFKSSRYDWLKETKREIELLFGRYCAIGYSQPFKQWDLLFSCYREALTVYSKRFFDGEDTQTEMHKPDHGFEINLTRTNLIKVNEIEEQILSAIYQRSEEILKQQIDKLFSLFLNSRMSLMEMHQLVTLLLEKVLNQFEKKQLDGLNMKHIIPIYWVQERKHIKELQDDLDDLLTKVVQSDYSSNYVTSYIKTIIEKEYGNPNLTIGDIAEKLHFNSSYLSNLFKLKTGKHYSQYLADYRLEKGKEILGKKHLKIYEVAFSVGYKNEKSFSRAFKRKYGLSPHEYREKWGWGSLKEN